MAFIDAPDTDRVPVTVELFIGPLAPVCDVISV